jgi:hypothetical protein
MDVNNFKSAWRLNAMLNDENMQLCFRYKDAVKLHMLSARTD